MCQDPLAENCRIRLPVPTHGLLCHWSSIGSRLVLVPNRPVLIAILLTTFTSSLSADVVLPTDAPAQLLFARDEIVRAAHGKSLPTITLEVRGSGAAQSYTIERSEGGWRVTGA